MIKKTVFFNLFFIFLLSFALRFSQAFLPGTSMLAGVLILSILIFYLQYKRWNNLVLMDKNFLYLIFVFFIYEIIVLIATTNFFNIKTYLSLVILFFIFCTTYLISFSLKNMEDVDLYKTIKYAFLAFFSLGAYHIVFIGGARDPFPFYEASHYALFIGPFAVVLYTLTFKKYLKMIILGWMILAGIFFPNTTILTYLILILLLSIKINIRSIILIGFSGFIFMSLVLKYDYFYDRVLFWDAQSSKNLSSLVYLQGIQDAHYSFVSTKGLGLGFQQLGTQKLSEAGLILQELLNNNTGLNRQDGGFTAAKIIAELGLLGILILLMYLILAKKAFFYLYNYLRGKENDLKLALSYGFIYAYSIELFVRGAGYFTQGSFMFFIALSYLFIRKNAETITKPQRIPAI